MKLKKNLIQTHTDTNESQMTHTDTQTQNCFRMDT